MWPGKPVMRSHNTSMREERPPKVNETFSQHKRSETNANTQRLLNMTYDYEAGAPHGSLIGGRSPPPNVNSMLRNILKKTFRHNHHEDLELSCLNYSQRNYLK